MPAYISHAIMGNEVYNKLINDYNYDKVKLDINELRGYSLGIDLASLSKNVSCNPHNYFTQYFFITMLNYIIENNLIENEHIIALLYGHIAHYFLDINVHPLVYYIEKGCSKVGIISNHHLVEGYYDYYLSKEIMKCDISDIDSSFFNQINLKNIDVKNLLNNVYNTVYNDKNIVKEYKRMLNIFSNIENVVKNRFVSRDFIIKVSRFNKFLKENNLSYEELVNLNNDIYTNPLTGDKCNSDLLFLFYKSINMCLEAINYVNKVLYENYPISILDNTFKDLSYDTGEACSLGKKLVYFRN